MQAIILAAGMGKRLQELTRNNTKCMVRVNGITLIERVMRQLEERDISRVVLVIGYQGEALREYVLSLNLRVPVIFVENPIYDRTNNIYSLLLAKDYLCEEDTLLFESDIIFEKRVLDRLIDDPRETLALVDKYESWMDGTCVTLNDEDQIVSFVPKKQFDFNEKDHYFKTVNIYKFSRRFSQTHYIPFLEAYAAALGHNEYYEQVLRVITMLDEPDIRAARLNGECWYEIDDIQDLNIAESLFAESDEKRLSLLESRYGGYWRYPGLLDFCYLVNGYYPPHQMMEEMKASFEGLLTQYPSGMGVNSLLAGKNFKIHSNHVVVGNGAAELIKALMERLPGKTGVIRPTFEEYPNRRRPEEVCVFRPKNDTLSYTADDVMNFFDGTEIQNLILINPDNPTGNYLPKADLMKLAEWCEERKISFVLDESFADFSDEAENTLITEEIMGRFPHLYVMKSISKSYGVPGIRLGILASSDEEMIRALKKDVSIWNINSFAEFFMQIEEKYRKDYESGLKKLRQERARFSSQLSEIPGLTVFPSQANYLLVKLNGEMTASTLSRRLLSEYNILVKDLSKKISEFPAIRIAVKNEAEDDRLISALREILY